jgi:hypothetical protein
MPGIAYEPEFHHDPWIDNLDRVTAAGDGGFNVRFQTLEAELHRIADAALEPGSIRSGHFDVIAGTQVTQTIGSGTFFDVVGPVITVTPPAQVLPLISVVSTTPNALFSVLPLYRMDANAAQVTTLFRVTNQSGFSIQIRATPYVMRG